MTFTEGITNGSESFSRHSNYHENGCAKEDSFDGVPKERVGCPEPKRFVKMVSYTFLYHHIGNQSKINYREAEIQN